MGSEIYQKYQCPTHGVTEHFVNFWAEGLGDLQEMDETFCLYCLVDLLKQHLPSIPRVDDA